MTDGREGPRREPEFADQDSTPDPGIGESTSGATPSPVPAAAERPRRWSGRTWTTVIAGLALLISGWAILGSGAGTGGGAIADSDHANISMHQARGSRSTLPLVLDDEDRDRVATRQAVFAARNNQALPAGDVAPSRVPEQVRAEIADEEVEFFSVDLFDTCAEDGDWVTIQLDNGLTFGPIPIMHRPTRILIPVNGNKPSRMVLIANRDGGGGVTVGLRTSTGVWYSQVMAEGYQQEIPLNIR